MTENCLTITSDNFDAIIRENDVVMVDFWASWCGPCKMLGPVIESVADDYAGKAVVGKVNVDDCPDLAERFGIMTIPAVYVFKSGAVVEKMIGLRQKPQFAAALDKNL